MRCEGCDGKFGANGEPEVEVEGEDISETSLSCDVRVDVPCANCGGEFKTGYVSIEAEIDDPDAHHAECEDDDGDRYFTIENADPQVSESYAPEYRERTLKDGTIKRTPVPHRFRTHYYDVAVTFDVTCSKCETVFAVTGSDRIAASGLEAV